MVLNESRHSLAFSYGDVLVIDTWHDLSPEDQERLREAAQPVYDLCVEFKTALIQLGPIQNIWPDRERPGPKRLGLKAEEESLA